MGLFEMGLLENGIPQPLQKPAILHTGGILEVGLTMKNCAEIKGVGIHVWTSR